MKHAWLALVAFALAGPALSKEKAPPPPAPTVEPDWGDVRAKGEALLKSALFDPGSAQIVWTEGFRWGYVKPIFGKKTYQWVACGTLNAKNRMGGYVGAQPFWIGVRSDGTVVGEAEPLMVASCFVPSEGHVAPQPALLPLSAPSAPSSVADELAKLAALRDKGIITQSEFDQQKAKLLAN